MTLMGGLGQTPTQTKHCLDRFISSIQGSCCDRSMTVVHPVVLRQQFALKACSSYAPWPIDSKLGRKHLGDLKINKSCQKTTQLAGKG